MSNTFREDKSARASITETKSYLFWFQVHLGLMTTKKRPLRNKRHLDQGI